MATNDQMEKQIANSLSYSKWFLCIAASIALVSLVIDICVPQGGYYWFQRSGSVVVLLSILAEYKLFKVHGEINPPSSTYVFDPKWKKKFGCEYKVISGITLVVAIGGTIIWGYGDIPLEIYYKCIQTN